VKSLAEQRMRERQITFGQALSEIGREQPELVQQYRRWVTSTAPEESPTVPPPAQPSSAATPSLGQTSALEISPPADGDKAGAAPPGQSVPTGAAEPAAPVESPKAMDREEFRALAAKLATHGLAGTQAKAITLINDYIARCDGKPSIGSVVKENAQKIARLLAHQLEKDGPGITVASIKAVLGT
jgi:hypothetical protein